MDANACDLLVVGGGITGAGIARDAAGRGLQVVMVDAGDVAQGTSSRSSRLIHGGLRYLETFDLKLVFEALAERARLLELAPHLVRPLLFAFPVFRGDPVGRTKLRAGMWLYDLLALFRNSRRHRMLGVEEMHQVEPRLRTDGLRGGALYFDAQVDDARLTLAVARAAHEAGAAVIPRAEVIGFLRGAKGIEGVRLRDGLSGHVQELRAKLVVNATGPWSDELRRLADPSIRPRLRPTKGVHILLRRERIGNRGAITFRSPVDGRVMFVLPWNNDFSYVGTTDTDFEGSPGQAAATTEDIDYLLKSANGLFPGAELVATDVVSTWAGIRPLLIPQTDRSAGATSREHAIWRDPSGLLNVAGGKLTTFRSMAAEAVDTAASILRQEREIRAGSYYTEYLALPGTPDGDWPEFFAGIVRRTAELGLPAGTGEHLARSYGADAARLLESVRQEPALGERIIPERPHLWAELSHAVQREMALTLDDLLQRRLHLTYETADGGLSVLEEIARRMAREPGIGWSAEEIQQQLDGYRAVVAATRGVPA